MNVLTIFEQRIGAIFESGAPGERLPFSFKRLAKRAVREMEDETFVIDGVDTAPALYTILVSSKDDFVMRPLYIQITNEISQLIEAQAKKRGYTFVGKPLVRFMVDPALRGGKFSVFAENIDPRTLARLRDEENAYLGITPPHEIYVEHGFVPEPVPVHEEEPAPVAREVAFDASAFEDDSAASGAFGDSSFETDDFGSDTFDEVAFANDVFNDIFEDEAAADEAEADAEAQLWDEPDEPVFIADTPQPDDAPDEALDEVPDDAFPQLENDEDEDALLSSAAWANFPDFNDEPETLANDAASTAEPVDFTQEPLFDTSVDEIVDDFDTTDAFRNVAPEPAEPSCTLVDLSSGQVQHVDKGYALIGRERVEGGVVVRDPNASRRHAELAFDGTTWRVRDLRSTNGTLVNDVDVAESILHDGDVLTIGLTNLEFRMGSR